VWFIDPVFFHGSFAALVGDVEDEEVCPYDGEGEWYSL
jgi:hypothetical protein